MLIPYWNCGRNPFSRFWDLSNKVQENVCRHGARARWSLNTSWTLTKLSQSLNGYLGQSPTEYKSRGEGARTLARARKSGPGVHTDGRTDARTHGRTERDTLKSYYGITSHSSEKRLKSRQLMDSESLVSVLQVFLDHRARAPL